jgi:hypothetical protein
MEHHHPIPPYQRGLGRFIFFTGFSDYLFHPARPPDEDLYSAGCCYGCEGEHCFPVISLTKEMPDGPVRHQPSFLVCAVLAVLGVAAPPPRGQQKKPLQPLQTLPHPGGLSTCAFSGRLYGSARQYRLRIACSLQDIGGRISINVQYSMPTFPLEQAQQAGRWVGNGVLVSLDVMCLAQPHD